MGVGANRAPTPWPRGKLAVLSSFWVHGLNVHLLCSEKHRKWGLGNAGGPILPTQSSARVEEENKHLWQPPDPVEKVITSSYPTDFCSSAGSLCDLFLTLEVLGPAGASPELRQLQIP